MPVITNLVAYWSLDESSGSAIDAHDDNDLTDNGSVGAASGKVAGCRDFESGSSQYFSITDNTDLSTGDVDFSIQAWVNLESNSGNYGIVGKWDFPNREYIVGYENGANRFFIGVSSNGSSFSGQRYASSFGGPSTATWYHIVAWHDAANNLLGIDINSSASDESIYSSGVFDSSTAFTIGRSPDTYTYFDGLIDEVGVWKKVLTGEERAWLYNSGSGRSYADIVAEAGGGFIAFPRPRGMAGGLLQLTGGMV